jgi:hypothetical protein
MPYKTIRERVWRNLMILRINEGIAQQAFAFTADPKRRHWREENHYIWMRSYSIDKAALQGNCRPDEGPRP